MIALAPYSYSGSRPNPASGAGIGSSSGAVAKPMNCSSKFVCAS